MTYLKYLKIKFKHGGRGWDSGDCLNLVRMFYECEYGITLMDHAGYEEDWHKHSNLFIDLVEQWGFYKVESPMIGDGVLMRKADKVTHCGVMVNEDYVLHTNRHGTAVHCKYDLPGRLEVYGFYRHKDRANAYQVP